MSTYKIKNNTSVTGTFTASGAATLSSTLDLGHASDTTISRSAAGTVQIEGVTIATASNTLTLTNKTLTTPTISSIVNTGTLTLPTSTDTLVGRATTDTLTNKTINLTSNTLVATSAQIATAVTDETGSGALVFATSPTLVTPALGTPSSGTLTNCTFPTLNQSTTGNAATATALQTARNINGVSFNGTADITVTAAASTLTGTTLASNVTASSLTSVGSLSSLTVSGTTTLQQTAEVTTISATAATGTIQFDVLTQAVLYYTSNASGNWTLNVRGSSGTALNSVMSTGQSLTIVFMVTNGATPYYQTSLTIDGVTGVVTQKWQGSTAPTAGNASAIDVYAITIIKTGANAYTVLESQTQFK